MNIFSNFFKKEAPLLGLQGSGGGLGFLIGNVAEFSVTGGTEITNGNVKYHVFITDQNLVVSGQGDVELLVVGGGGAATGPYSAGGGAGGIAHDHLFLLVWNLSVVVGTKDWLQQLLRVVLHHRVDSSVALPIGTITGLGGGSGTQDAYQLVLPNIIRCGGGNADDSVQTQVMQHNHYNLILVLVNQWRTGFGPPSGNAPETLLMVAVVVDVELVVDHHTLIQGLVVMGDHFLTSCSSPCTCYSWSRST